MTFNPLGKCNQIGIMAQAIMIASIGRKIDTPKRHRRQENIAEFNFKAGFRRLYIANILPAGRDINLYFIKIINRNSTISAIAKVTLRSSHGFRGNRHEACG